MPNVYVIGAFMTAFGKRHETSHKALTAEAFEGVLADAGLPDGGDIDVAWFGSCALPATGQTSIGGQVCLSPLAMAGRLPPRLAIINVENACATSSTAINGAWKDILAGQAHLALALGMDKLFNPDPSPRGLAGFAGGADQLDPELWIGEYRRAGEAVGKPFETGPDRSPFMDTYALQALWYMKRHGATQRQFAMAAAKAHCNGALNPNAQYRFPMTVEQVLEDRVVSHPLTRAMCAPIGDGAAAVLLCSEDYLKTLPERTRSRALRVRASALSGGKYRDFDEPSLSAAAAAKAYDMAGLQPFDIDLAEVHDATSFSELYQPEMLGFCDTGGGGRLVESGATRIDGRIPINTSGGLVSKGHPIAATGAAMVVELAQQIRHEAGERQVPGARIGLAENGGGVMGFDEAVCSVIILEGCS